MLASGVCKGSSLTGETPSHSVPAAFGRFQVLHQIGAGVLGPVFLARDPDRGRSVAIKAFRLDITPEQGAELASQLSALARANLAHPSIVAPFEAGVEGTVAYLAEDFVSADSLDAAIRQYGPPPTAQAIRILAAVAGGLDFAAAVGVHHGALHPRDLLVTPDDTRLTGLGIGRALEAIGLRAPIRRPYVAPERAQREGWDARADIYSLGVLAREILVGRSRGEPTESRLPDDQAERLHPVLARATAARPADRFTTSLEFIGAVQDAVTGSAASAGPPPAVARGGRGRRTHDLLLPLDADAPAAAEAQSGVNASRADAAPGLSEALADDLPARSSAVTPPLGDLDLHRGADDAGQRVEGFDLSDLDGRLADEPATSRTDAPEVEAGELRRADGEGERARSRLAGGAFDQPLAIGAEPGETEPAVTEPATARPPFGDFFEPGVEPSPDEEPRITMEAASIEGGAPVVAGRSRSRAVPLVAVLLVGIVLGVIAGYLFGARRTPSAPVASAPAAAVSPEAAAPASPTPAAVTPTRPAAAATGAPSSPVGSPTQQPGGAATASSPSPPAALRAANTVLVVRSTPRGATVLVNGRRRGTTPLRLRDLQPGRYTVRVNRRGFDPEERDVVLSADHPSSTLAFSLDRTDSAQPASRTTDFYGSLSVESLPSGARVFVDGRLIGTTPIDSARVSAGSHVVRVDRIGFHPWTSPIQVVTGQRHRVTASLEREPK